MYRGHPVSCLTGSLSARQHGANALCLDLLNGMRQSSLSKQQCDPISSRVCRPIMFHHISHFTCFILVWLPRCILTYYINTKRNKTHQNIETGCFIFYFASRGETGYLKISDVVKGCCRAEILSLFKGSFWGSGSRTFYHTGTMWKLEKQRKEQLQKSEDVQ